MTPAGIALVCLKYSNVQEFLPNAGHTAALIFGNLKAGGESTSHSGDLRRD